MSDRGLDEAEIAARRLVARLTPDELQLLVALVRGMSARDVAAGTGLDTHEIEGIQATMMAKLDATATADAVRIGLLAHVDLMN